MNISDDLREYALKSYFHLCKEKAAKRFIEWRLEQAELVRDPVMRQALRLRRLSEDPKFNKEESIFNLYQQYESNFESVREKLIQMELQLQEERNVPMQDSMN